MTNDGTKTMSNDTKKLFDLVLFESDRTCCLCREKERPVQIHHIDGNHSNNERSNLAVFCALCHTLAHTNVPFARDLTPDQVRLYDKSWRDICSAKLLPNAPPEDELEYRQEVILEVNLACHGWKNSYMRLYPGHFENVEGEFHDIWEKLKSGSHADTSKERNHYQRLFQEDILTVVNRLQQILAGHGDVVPIKLKKQMLRTIRQLHVEASVYMFPPEMCSIKSRN